MIDDLDTISSNIDEHTYLRLANGLQRLYNIHNSTIQTSSTNNRETLAQRQHERYRENFQTNNEVQINRNLARHYGRIYDISGIPAKDFLEKSYNTYTKLIESSSTLARVKGDKLIPIDINLDSEENIVLTPIPIRGSIDLPARNVALSIEDNE
jgi:hypothetical protein